MYHPLFGVPRQYRARLAAAVGLITTVFTLVMASLDRTLLTPEGLPAGLSLPLAGDPLVTASIVAGWTLPQLALAQNLIVLDFAFLGFYSTLVATACLWACGLWHTRWVARLGVWLAWMSWVAGALDIAENAATFSILRSALEVPRNNTSVDAFVVSVARMTALGKWALLEIAMVYVAISALVDAVAGVRSLPLRRR